MGTDRSQIYSSSCPCGCGEITINFCTPDHGWPTRSNWIEKDIGCPKCSEEFEIVVQRQHYVLVKKLDSEVLQEKAGKLNEQICVIYQELKVLPETGELVQKFREVLEEQPSLAARHRFLTSSGLEHSSIATFRKRWTGATEWIQENITLLNLDTVMNALDVRDEKIVEKLRAAEDLKKQRQAILCSPLPIVGEPLLKVAKD